MASNLLDEFKKVQRGLRADHKLLLPLYKWFSSKERNIENMQRINRRFLSVNSKILISELALNINVGGFMRMPKRQKDKYPFFYIQDVAKYYEWTPTELDKNRDVICLDSLRTTIADAFCYDDTQRKDIGLQKQRMEKWQNTKTP